MSEYYFLNVNRGQLSTTYKPKYTPTFLTRPNNAEKSTDKFYKMSIVKKKD